MAILDTYISDLLYQYDCVVIPGFGGFVANYRPAQIDAERGRFHPPGKDIGFNINLQKNDGLLASYLCDKKNISASEAATLIRNAVETYRYTLDRGESLNFQNIGVLHLDKENRMHFAPADQLNYLRSSFGLESFSLPRLSGETANTAEKLQDNAAGQLVDIRQYQAHKSGTGKGRSRWYWTAAALVPILGFSYFALQNPATENTTLAEIFSLGKGRSLYQPAVHQTLEISSTPLQFPENSEAFEFSFLPDADSIGTVWISNEASGVPAVPEKITAKSSGLYHIIVGCFSQKQNAEELVERFRAQNLNAFIVDHHKGLYRVAAESFSDFQQALTALSATKAGEVPQAWLLKKVL